KHWISYFHGRRPFHQTVTFQLKLNRAYNNRPLKDRWALFDAYDDIEKAAIETIEISGTKAQLMAYLTGDDASGRTLEFLHESAIDYKEVLEYFLSEIQIGYKKSPLNATFSYEVFSQSPPEVLNDFIEESKETGESVIYNKINEGNLFKKNYLVFYYCYNGDEYVTVINSYTYPFDIFDKYLFELLHKIVSKNIENIEYMVVLTHTDN
ncbi:hypothetical protein, partial [Sporosarcina sp. BP05]|uniref:hypothetical protein n=1 Tax=Sporosarcina sp. BP05 TaxID=2758726 RepID=UPI0016484E7C